MKRFIRRVFSLAPLSSTEVFELLLGGISLCGFLLLEVRPDWLPPQLPPVVMAIGLLAIARAVVGIIAALWPRGPLVDLAAYAATLDHDNAARDIAHLPNFPALLDGSVSEPIDALRGTVILVGGHGAGKSRLAALLAAQRLRRGDHGIHVLLGAWKDSLEGLTSATLSAAAGKATSVAQLEEYLSTPGAFVALDSIDEVPEEDRSRVAHQLALFARAHPGVDFFVTARPYVSTSRLEGWRQVYLAALTSAQVEEALGGELHRLRLAPPVEKLATQSIDARAAPG